MVVWHDSQLSWKFSCSPATTSSVLPISRTAATPADVARRGSHSRSSKAMQTGEGKEVERRDISENQQMNSSLVTWKPELEAAAANERPTSFARSTCELGELL